MTSNQIQAQIAREQERHDKRQEALAAQQQAEIERQNRINNILSLSKNINEAAGLISQTSTNSNKVAIEAAAQANQQAYTKEQLRQHEKELEIQGYSQQEIKRHNEKLEELQLRDIKHLEYQDRLVEIRDQWNRSQDIVENNLAIAKNTIAEAKNSIDAFYAQLERAKVNTEALRVQSQLLNDEYERKLTQARTNAQRHEVVSSYLSSIGQLLKGVSGIISIGGF